MSQLTFQYRLHESIPDTAILTLQGSIDAATVASFQDEVETLERRGVQRFILDMEGINYVNSTGLGALVRLADKLETDGGFVALVKIHPKVSVVFDMLGLNAFFRIFPNMIHAEQELNRLGVQARPGGSAAAGPKAGAMAAPASPAPASRSINCQTCGAELRIAASGTFRCSRCYTAFTVPADGGPIRFDTGSAASPPAGSAPAPGGYDSGYSSGSGRGGGGMDAFSAPAEDTFMGSFGDDDDAYGSAAPAEEMVAGSSAVPPPPPPPPPPPAPKPAMAPAPAMPAMPSPVFRTAELPPPSPQPMMMDMEADEVAAPAPARASRARSSAPAKKMAKKEEAAFEGERARRDDAAPAAKTAAAEAPARRPAPMPSGGTLRRQATVRYFKRMNPFKHFPVVVILSREQIQQMAVPTATQVTGERGGFVVKADKPVIEVVPQFPGCQCVPDRLHVDVSGEQEAVTFWVTPQTEGRLDRAAVEIWYQGERVETIRTPCHVARRTMARVAAMAGVVFPVFSSSLETATGQTSAERMGEAVQGLPALAAIVGGMTNLGLIVGGICVLAAILGWWLTRPLEADPVNALLESEIKPAKDGGDGSGGVGSAPIDDPGAPLHLKMPCRPHATESLVAMIESEALSAGLPVGRVNALRRAVEEIVDAITNRGLCDEPDNTYSVLIAPRPGQINLRFAQHGHAMHETEIDPLPVARATFDEFKIGPHSKGGDLITLRMS